MNHQAHEEDLHPDQKHSSSAKLETEIERIIAQGLGDPDCLAEFGPLGGRLVIQRAVKDEVTRSATAPATSISRSSSCENQDRSLIKQYGFPCAIGLKFRDQLRQLLGKDHPLSKCDRATSVNPCGEICKQRSKFGDEVRQCWRSRTRQHGA